MKFSHILVDADILLYSVGFATQKNIYHVWLEGYEGDPWIWTDKRALNKVLKNCTEYEIHQYLHVQPFFSATETVDAILVGLKTRLGTPKCQVELYLTGEGNFREEIATIQPYKGNRTADKPVHYHKIKEYLISKQALVVGGQEADDELSIRQYELHREGKTSVICSIDKDLNMVPGWHYNSTRDELYNVQPVQGIRWFYEQMLQGDSADNIPGIKGIGPKTATKLLAQATGHEQMESIVIEMYKEAFPDTYSDRLLEIGRLLWMRTYPDELWHPLERGGCV